MEMLSGADMIVRSMIDQGVKHIFGYPGGSVLDIYDALHEKAISNMFSSAMSRQPYIWLMAMPVPRVMSAWCW